MASTDLPFIPPAKPIIGEEERAAVDAVLRSGMIASGPETKAFEKEFSEHMVEGRETVAVNAGTSGQHLGMLSVGVKPGDEVIVPSFTFAATPNSVAVIGAVPVFVDIDQDTFCMDPAAFEAAITERTKAVMPVHLYGHPANITEIVAIAKKHGLLVGEDAAQAHGAVWQGHKVGTFGDFGMFSLYPTKNMTSGEGGMVSCATPEIARTVRLWRNQGMEKQYENEIAGLNNRMTDIHASIGRVQLTKVDAWTRKRQELAAYYDENLKGVTVPPVAAGAEHVYHQYTIRLDGASGAERDRFVAALREEYKVGSGVYYPIPCHRLPSFSNGGYGTKDVDLPVTDKVAQEVISLPVHPSVSESDRERVVAAVNALAAAGTGVGA